MDKAISTFDVPHANSRSLPLAFLLRRFHSLIGLYAVIALLAQIFHAFTRVFSPGEITAVNEAFAVRAPGLSFITLHLPLLFYFLYGTGLWLSGKSNLLTRPTRSNFIYDLERVTGLFALPFVLAYLWIFRIGPPMGGQNLEIAGLANFFSIPLTWIVFTVGMILTAVHVSCLLRRVLFGWGVVLHEPTRHKIFVVSLIISMGAALLTSLAATRLVYHFVPAPSWLEALHTAVERLFF